MTLSPARNSPARTLALLGLAALLAIALWAYLPVSFPSPLEGRSAASLPPSIFVDGTVEVTSVDGAVSRLVVPLAVRGDDPILLTSGRRLHASTFMSESAAAAVPAVYTVSWLDGNGDELLDPGEHAVLTIDLPVPSPVRPDNPMELIIRPVEGVPLIIKDVLP
jgi:hypothetical protein